MTTTNINLEKGEELYNKYITFSSYSNNESFKEVFALPEEDYLSFVEYYNLKAEELSSHLVEMISFINRKNNFFHLYRELPFLNYLIKITHNNKSGIYVPHFEEAQALKLLLGCSTACVSPQPLRIIFFLEFAHILSNKGLLFILLHESQHFMRGHFERMQKRHPEVWNIATDTLINYSVLNDVLPSYFYGGFNYSPEYLADLFVENFPSDSFSGVGLVLSDKDTKQNPMNKYFLYDTVINLVKNQNLTEEEIYNLIVSDYNNSLKQSSHKNSNANCNSGNGQSSSSNSSGNKSNDDFSNSLGNNSNDDGSKHSQANKNRSNEDSSTSQSSSLENDHKDISDIDNIIEKAKNSKKLFDDKMTDMFSDKKDRIEKAMQDVVKNFGFPKSKTEYNQNDLHKLKKELAKESERIRSGHKGYTQNGSDNFDEILKRAENAVEKLKIVTYLKNLSQHKAKHGEYRKSQELTRFSRKTKVPVINEMLGIGNKIDIYKKEKFNFNMNILCILDTSGSVSEHDIVNKFFNCIKNFILDYNANLVFISADTEAKTHTRFLINKENFAHFEKNGYTISGFGGTELLSPLVYELANSYIDYDLCLILSDGYYPTFTKQDLMDLAHLHIKNMNKDSVNYILNNSEKKNKVLEEFRKVQKKVTVSHAKNKAKKLIANNKYHFPPIVLINTQEKVFSNKINTFLPHEVREFLI